MSKLLEQIKSAQCLVLDKRINLFHDLKWDLSEKGICLQPFIAGDGSNKDLEYDHIDTKELPPRYQQSINYATWWNRPAAYNAWLSHKKMMEQTLHDGYDHILIIEDDAFIEKDFDEILLKTELFWLDNTYDIVYFGCFLNEQKWEPTSNENVLRVQRCGGLHACLLTKPIIEELLKFPPIGPYDWILSEYKFHEVFKSYAIYPSIISQRSGYSFVEESNLDKPSRYIR